MLSSFVVTSSSSAELVFDPNSTRSDLKSFPIGDVRSEENNHYYNIVLGTLYYRVQAVLNDSQFLSVHTRNNNIIIRNVCGILCIHAYVILYQIARMNYIQVLNILINVVREETLTQSRAWRSLATKPIAIQYFIISNVYKI